MILVMVHVIMIIMLMTFDDENFVSFQNTVKLVKLFTCLREAEKYCKFLLYFNPANRPTCPNR